jgi:hypothetical protein
MSVYEYEVDKTHQGITRHPRKGGTSAHRASSGGLNPAVIWILLAVALVAGGATAMKVFQAK